MTTIEAIVDRRGETVRVLAPAIGWWDGLPAGGWLGPGSTIGRLRTGTRLRRLVLPDDCAGRVRAVHPGGRRGVAYLEPLLELEAVGVDPAAAGDESGGEAARGLAVRSPTDGVFFRRPSPDAPPFVEPGSRIRRGQPVGLVEVMKTFNQVLYGGEGLPDEAEVVRLDADDGAEVASGQTLLVVRPV